MDGKRDKEEEEIAHLEALVEYYRRQMKKIQELIDRIKVNTRKPD